MSQTDRTQDEKWMSRALDLAVKGMGHVSPNPMVGAVIVRDGEVIGEGWHEHIGGLHAERNALADCRRRGNDPEGADLYVSLEPCCHYGKTPPCTEAVIENKIGRVIYGMTDPNPLVAGKGLQILRDAGIEVDGPVLEDECKEINKIFIHYITTKLPYVIVKYAMTADGKIATVTGDSKWITGEEARKQSHGIRKQVSAIMVGVGTVLADDPMLTCRTEEGVNPIRIICDSNLRTPADSQIAKSAKDVETIIAFGAAGELGMKTRADALKAAGIKLWEIPRGEDEHLDMETLIRRMGEEGIDSVLVEGGSEIHFSVCRTGFVSEVNAYIAPKIVGGADAKPPVGGEGFAKLSDCLMLGRPTQVQLVGDDVLLVYRPGKE
ncbi:MAG: bifunctional diaminohydroxyphosphoribosylaminopyrimidine deaminase/5-amino-6-(5-phosphoribosylamino)uracil reductase RibD [Anaerovoracaceae bacterium]|nr:bifunctional diaminohydroxyphosphoribosylaminopyrimidine deaminase/5-amino-6-(5-phosphoribosylamino)uracil reductase RibD [Bacillota bacterium]MDY2670393.1 bifunctional diaminohydroxyphosphoribosylaminopyrimidine deaminase/5-amino-6-(5-phosphoribosylamino)uracil reductase RibD [Anaerovoracaceae bacterium]